MEMKCDNCGWTGPDTECEIADDVWERHETGCIYSSEQCPECGALCFPTDIKWTWPYIARDDIDGWARWLCDQIGNANARAVIQRLDAVCKETE